MKKNHRTHLAAFAAQRHKESQCESTTDIPRDKHGEFISVFPSYQTALCSLILFLSVTYDIFGHDVQRRPEDGWLESIWGEACCDSDWESWVKRQRNALTLRPCERALWQTTIKSPIVAANVKLIGRTLREEPLSSRDSFILRVTAGFSCVSPGRSCTLAFNSALPKATQTLWGRAILKLAWKRWLAWCLCQMAV